MNTDKPDIAARLTGSQHLAKVLQGYGVTHVFHVPAVLLKTLAAMEELPIQRIVTHGEKSAAYMADGYARASGKPGICFAQNIGSSNLAAGLRDARMGNVPMIAITGGPNADSRYRNYYQEIEDFGQFDAVTKMNVSVDHVSRLPDLMRQAFRVATSGAPGPVHIRLPGVTADDIMGTESELPVIVEERFSRTPAYRPAADGQAVTEAVRMLRAARRPIIIAGGGVITSGAAADIVKFAEALQIPVATSLNAKGAILDNHPLAVGVAGTYSRRCANEAISDADLVFFVGSKTGGQVTTRWKVPHQRTQIIHLDINADELGRNYPKTHPLLGDARVVLRQLISAAQKQPVPDRTDWLEHTGELVRRWWASEMANLESEAVPMRPERVCRALSEVLPANAVLVSDTGHSGMWSGVMVEFLRPGQRYIRCAGSLGWALPGAIGVKCALPDTPVVCFAGDGASYYHLAELETAVRYGINVVFVINNNNALNQEIYLYDDAYGGKQYGRSEELWRFTKVSFAKVAEALGCASIRVETPGELNAALDRALKMNKPVVVETMTDTYALAKNGWAPPESE
jgi:acetolactate synthase-1/2/3 large subunit